MKTRPESAATRLGLTFVQMPGEPTVGSHLMGRHCGGENNNAYRARR